MKKRNWIKSLIGLAIALSFMLASLQGTAIAAGSCTLTSTGGQTNFWRQYTCTADASDGTIASYTVRGFVEFYLYTVETWPGATAPTDDSGYTLTDSSGGDLMGGNGVTAIDATDYEVWFPASAAMNLNIYPMIKGDMTLSITQATTATNSAIIYVRITGVK